MQKIYDKIKKFWKLGLVVIIVLIVVIMLLSVLDKEEEPEMITKTSLEKIIDVNELSTYEIVYNGVAEVMNEKKPEKTDYYVSYEATVKAGIDFEQIKIDVNNEEKKISIAIPEITITDINVDINSLDFMFENDKAETDTVSEQAYKACIHDVTNETSEQTAIYELAEQNAKNVIEALVSPLLNQLDEEYSLEIN